MKKKHYLSIIFSLLLFALLALLLYYSLNKVPIRQVEDKNPQNTYQYDEEEIIDQPSISEPITNSLNKITKKPFGLYITPQNSPVDNDRFSGYHTGTDFEVTEEEIEKEISITAICEGEILLKQYVSGYGGLIIQGCKINSSDVTVLYGHIDLNSSVLKVGEVANRGAFLAHLGQEKSRETDGERKHLHLGIHKGNTINYLGYVSEKNLLSEWINYEELIRS